MPILTKKKKVNQKYSFMIEEELKMDLDKILKMVRESEMELDIDGILRKKLAGILKAAKKELQEQEEQEQEEQEQEEEQEPTE